ncbi:Uncharacterized protein PBTT_10051 [Plasmodiophora brassicae]
MNLPAGHVDWRTTVPRYGSIRGGGDDLGTADHGDVMEHILGASPWCEHRPSPGPDDARSPVLPDPPATPDPPDAVVEPQRERQAGPWQSASELKTLRCDLLLAIATLRQRTQEFRTLRGLDRILRPVAEDGHPVAQSESPSATEARSLLAGQPPPPQGSVHLCPVPLLAAPVNSCDDPTSSSAGDHRDPARHRSLGASSQVADGRRGRCTVIGARPVGACVQAKSGLAPEPDDTDGVRAGSVGRTTAPERGNGLQLVADTVTRNGSDEGDDDRVKDDDGDDGREERIQSEQDDDDVGQVANLAARRDPRDGSIRFQEGTQPGGTCTADEHVLVGRFNQTASRRAADRVSRKRPRREIPVEEEGTAASRAKRPRHDSTPAYPSPDAIQVGVFSAVFVIMWVILFAC